MSYCRRRKDEYGNRHDTVVLQHNSNIIAEVVERGRTDEYRTIFVVEAKSVKMIILISGAETICHEYKVTVDEMCRILHLEKKNVKILLEPDIAEYCPDLQL
jgi:hypothetical protein